MKFSCKNLLKNLQENHDSNMPKPYDIKAKEGGVLSCWLIFVFAIQVSLATLIGCAPRVPAGEGRLQDGNRTASYNSKEIEQRGKNRLRRLIDIFGLMLVDNELSSENYFSSERLSATFLNGSITIRSSDLDNFAADISDIPDLSRTIPRRGYSVQNFTLRVRRQKLGERNHRVSISFDIVDPDIKISRYDVQKVVGGDWRRDEFPQLHTELPENPPSIFVRRLIADVGVFRNRRMEITINSDENLASATLVLE